MIKLFCILFSVCASYTTAYSAEKDGNITFPAPPGLSQTSNALPHLPLPPLSDGQNDNAVSDNAKQDSMPWFAMPEVTLPNTTEMPTMPDINAMSNQPGNIPTPPMPTNIVEQEHVQRALPKTIVHLPQQTNSPATAKKDTDNKGTSNGTSLPGFANNNASISDYTEYNNLPNPPMIVHGMKHDEQKHSSAEVSIASPGNVSIPTIVNNTEKLKPKGAIPANNKKSGKISNGPIKINGNVKNDAPSKSRTKPIMSNALTPSVDNDTKTPPTLEHKISEFGQMMPLDEFGAKKSDISIVELPHITMDAQPELKKDLLYDSNDSQNPLMAPMQPLTNNISHYNQDSDLESQINALISSEDPNQDDSDNEKTSRSLFDLAPPNDDKGVASLFDNHTKVMERKFKDKRAKKELQEAKAQAEKNKTKDQIYVPQWTVKTNSRSSDIPSVVKKKYVPPEIVYRRKYGNNNTSLPSAMYESDYEVLTFRTIKENNIGAFVALLDKVNDLEIRNGNGDTPLIYAAMLGKIDLVRILLARGADPYAKNNYRVGAAVAAGRAGHIDSVNLINEFKR